MLEDLGALQPHLPALDHVQYDFRRDGTLIWLRFRDLLIIQWRKLGTAEYFRFVPLAAEPRSLTKTCLRIVYAGSPVSWARNERLRLRSSANNSYSGASKAMVSQVSLAAFLAVCGSW